MVDLPPEYILSTTLKVGIVYKFSAEEYINSDIPHFFIVVAIDDDEIYTVNSTSQKNNKIKFFDKKGLDYSGLVFIKPDTDNGFTHDDNCVNCNDYYSFSKQSLLTKINSNNFEIAGTISYNHFDQIRNGICSSHINDLPCDMLIHPDDDLA
ncbi:MAG TPA: hypothetical protein VIN73_06075 [Vicingaceae bacterium]